MIDYFSNKSDMHLHTIASDGKLNGSQIIELAHKFGLKNISVTDHDSIKVYKSNDINYHKTAREHGVNLITGIEMDSDYNGVEVHILGYDFDVKNLQLNQYLSEVSYQRKRRIIEQIYEINNKIGREIVKQEDIINEFCDTYMKPHLILELKKTQYFDGKTYKEIKLWLAENISVKTEVIKPESNRIVRMLKDAGAKVFLAHPGYYIFYKSLELEALITELQIDGLDGIELIYPYAGEGSEINIETEKELIKNLKLLAKKFSLSISRGSDTHDQARFKSFNNN